MQVPSLEGWWYLNMRIQSDVISTKSRQSLASARQQKSDWSCEDEPGHLESELKVVLSSNAPAPLRSSPSLPFNHSIRFFDYHRQNGATRLRPELTETTGGADVVAEDVVEDVVDVVEAVEVGAAVLSDPVVVAVPVVDGAVVVVLVVGHEVAAST